MILKRSIVKDEKVQLLVDGTQYLHEIITHVKVTDTTDKPKTVASPFAIPEILQDKATLAALLILMEIEVARGGIVGTEGVAEHLLFAVLAHVMGEHIKTAIRSL